MAKMLKKLMALAVLMIFVISVVPTAFAEDVVDDTTVSEDVIEDATESSEDVDDSTGKIKPIKRLKQVQKKVEVARDRLIKAKEKYVQHRELVKEKRQELIQLRDGVKGCDAETEDCGAKKKRLRQGVTNHLVNTGNLIESSIERLIEKVENSLVLTDEEKEEALAKLEELEAELTAEKEELKTLHESGEASAEEIKAAIKDLKEAWKEIRKEQRSIIALLISSKLENLQEKMSEEFVSGMEMRIENLQAEGIDTSELESLLADYQAKMDELADSIATAKEKRVESIEEWKAAHKEVREDLKEAKQIMRDFIKEFRELKKEVKADDSSEDSEDESSEESNEEASTTSEE